MSANDQAPGWRRVLTNLRQRKVLVMLLLGFSSGLPLYLVGNTLGFWMRENAIDLSMIGFLSWVGLAYSLKFLWAPLVDKVDAPVFGRFLGRRRGWMLLSQALVGAALVGMALVQPRDGELVLAGIELNRLVMFGLLALVVAFSSATQDIVIDAWRIESADNDEQQSLLTSSAMLGYRGALLVTDALILILAAHVGWQVSYEVMALLMAVGIGATLYAREPARALAARSGDAGIPLGISNVVAIRWLVALVLGFAWIGWVVLIGISEERSFDVVNVPLLLLMPVLAWSLSRRPQGDMAEATWARPLIVPVVRTRDAVFEPLAQFFLTHGRWAVWMLLAISLYRLPDFVMGPMANPFYADLGIDKEMVGAVRGSIGLVATVAGIAMAGISAVRWGFLSTLLAGAVLGPGSNLAFTWLAFHGADPGAFTIAMSVDNFCTGFAGVALVGYMSSLTNIGYTATQYALLSSFYALLGKVLKGFSGVAVESLETGRSLIEAYAWYFAGTAALGIPAVLLCMLLATHRGRHGGTGRKGAV